MLTRRTFLALSGAAAFGPSTVLAANAVSTTGGRAFGTYWRLTVPRGTRVDTLRLAAIIEEVDREFSPFRADSALTAFNRGDTSDWLPAPEGLTRVLARSLQIAVKTDGAFDPTIGPLVHRYGFGPIRAEAWGVFEQIDVDEGAIRKADARLSLDLCGIAKGHALDRLTAELENQGVDDFLLDLGGELSARGLHPAGRAWQVAIESRDGRLPVAVALGGRAIATSGIAAQSYGRSGPIASHIIDPHAESPVGGTAVTVSVLAADATTADGWATGLMAMAPEKALGLAESAGIDALVFLRDGDSLRMEMTGRFADHLLT